MYNDDWNTNGHRTHGVRTDARAPDGPNTDELAANARNADGRRSERFTLNGRQVLVCLDGSESSAACVPYAVALAKTFGSEINLVRVLQPRHDRSAPHDALTWEFSRQEAQRYLDRMQAEVSATLGRPVRARLEQGIPAERIVDLAYELGADLTVMGSHGDGGATPWGLGSTVQRVFRAAHKSVLVAHGSPATSKDGRPKRILVPLDGSLRSESVLPAAARIACGFGAELLLVHVVHETMPTLLLQAAECVELADILTTRLASVSAKYLARLQRQLVNAGTSVSTLVARHSSERQCLLELTHEQQADLIVISAHGAACDPARSFGSVAPYLLAYSKVPLLVLQDLPDAELERSHKSGVASGSLRMSAAYTPGMG